MTEPDVTVLGAGVNGITSALALQLWGYDTRVVADRLAYQDEDPPSPAFASMVGAGAVLPYLVEMDDLQTVFRDSEAVFGRLEELGCAGVREDASYWVVEDATERPEDLELLDGVTETDPSVLPSRAGAGPVQGWRTDLYMADMPYYMNQLYRFYRAAGGHIEQRHVGRDDLDDLPGVVVNCTGIRSPALFPDDAPYVAMRGHLVCASGDFPRTDDGRITSYYYESTTHEEGTYCFPRMDGLMLGGTHQASLDSYHPDEEPAFPPLDEPTRDIDGVEMPARIVDLNAELLAQFGIDIDTDDLDALVGYRPYRDPDGAGVRLETAEEACGTVVHNYGHGGAGITLSWGCAVRVVRLVEDLLGAQHSMRSFDRQHAVLGHLRSALATLV